MIVTIIITQTQTHTDTQTHRHTHTKCYQRSISFVVNLNKPIIPWADG